ncbi:transposase [Escherichia coli]|nr:transposase [Escherichia coli]
MAWFTTAGNASSPDAYHETTTKFPYLVRINRVYHALDMKAVTSRRLRNEFLDLRAAYGKAVLWSGSYFAGSCGGAPLEVVKQYIQHQRG